MTYLFSDGFDGHGALADRWTVVDAGASIVTDGGKYGAGTNSLKLIGTFDTNATTFSITPTNTRGGTLNPVHLSGFLKTSSTPAASRPLALIYSITDNDAFMLAMNTSGNLVLGRWTSAPSVSTAASEVGSASGASNDGLYHHVELKFVVDNTSGIAKLWVDGILEIDFSGDTLQAGTITGDGVDKIQLVSQGTIEFDDLLIWDEEGSSMNTTGQLGVHRIETIIPDGDGNSSQLTPTGAGTTNADRVDEVGADDDTTYVESGTATHKDLYTYGNMAGTPSVVEGVVVHTRGTNADTGTISFKTKIRSNVTEGTGATFQVPASGVYGQFADFIALDPDGAVAWDKTNIDAAEFGVEVV